MNRNTGYIVVKDDLKVRKAKQFARIIESEYKNQGKASLDYLMSTGAITFTATKAVKHRTGQVSLDYLKNTGGITFTVSRWRIHSKAHGFTPKGKAGHMPYSSMSNQTTSIKLYNVLFNYKQLIGSIPNFIAWVASVKSNIITDKYVLAICSFLFILKQLQSLMTISITANDAVILAVLWNNCDGNQQISLDRGYEVISKIPECPIKDREEYEAIIDKLIQLRSITMEDCLIQLKETVSAKYYK